MRLAPRHGSAGGDHLTLLSGVPLESRVAPVSAGWSGRDSDSRSISPDVMVAPTTSTRSERPSPPCALNQAGTSQVMPHCRHRRPRHEWGASRQGRVGGLTTASAVPEIRSAPNRCCRLRGLRKCFPVGPRAVAPEHSSYSSKGTECQSPLQRPGLRRGAGGAEVSCLSGAVRQE